MAYLYDNQNMHFPDPIYEIFTKLQNKGFTTIAVGGAVRDFLLGQLNHDYDLASSANPENILHCFPNSRLISPHYGTVSIYSNCHITPFRKESKYTDYRHPDYVCFGATLDEDLSRRDFTINAIGYNPITGIYHDPFLGKSDILDRTLRCVGTAYEKLGEDSLRLFRLCRLSAQLGFTIEEKTQKAAIYQAKRIVLPSATSIQKEFLKLIYTPYPSIGFKTLKAWGLLKKISQEWGSLDIETFQELDTCDYNQRLAFLVKKKGITLLKVLNFSKVLIKEITNK
jgi:hypothetical protein